MNEIERNQNLVLIKVLKNVNAMAYKAFCDLVYGFHKVDLKKSVEGDIITVELPSSELFKKAYGPVKISFKNSIKPYNIVEVQPKKYLKDCHVAKPIAYKGIMIPNTGVDKFKIDLALEMYNNESKI